MNQEEPMKNATRSQSSNVTPQNIIDRVKKYNRQRKSAGLAQVRVWVPKGKKSEVVELAQRLRGELTSG